MAERTARKRKLLDEEAAVRAYMQGDSIRKIAADTGWSYSGLHGRLSAALRRSGHAMRARGGAAGRSARNG